MYNIEIRNISKSFAGVKALKNVSFSIRKGEVHAITGENGAGKSTLMKILGGVYRKDEGQIFINGKEQHISKVSDATAAGISVIFQEFNLIQELSVAENIFLTSVPKKNFFRIVDKAKRNNNAKELLEMLHVDVDPNELVKNLSVSKKQMIEIAKALSHESEIIIMDEPTAALNEEEVQSLFNCIQMLKKQSKTILYISHRMKEIFDITDTVTVLRDGRYIDSKPTKELTEEDIVKMMVGKELDRSEKHASHVKSDVLLSVKNLNLDGVYQDVSFDLHAGEILGFAGLMGCGREEILSTIYGLIQVDSGEIFVEGKKAHIHNVRNAIKKGVGFGTNDRKDSGIFPLVSVSKNTTMISIRHLKKLLGFYIPPKDEIKMFLKMAKKFDLKYTKPSQKIMYLSGGNQQKALLGRALLTNCKILILLEPTRGIDVATKNEIYKLLYELAASGIGIITVFSDLTELITVCDRALVMREGKIVAEIERKEFDKNTILTYAVGKGSKREVKK